MIELPQIVYDRQVQIPEYKGRTPREVWPPFFQQYRPRPEVVGRLVLNLQAAGEHEQVIGCIQAALIAGQGQPWMYELLAIAMERAGRPQEEIERVVLSLGDFGAVDYPTLMYSGAYLANFQRPLAALKMYRQASRLLPERPEPYILGLALARKAELPVEIGWAAAGILEYDWTRGYPERHREARIAHLEARRLLEKAGQADQVKALDEHVAAAQLRDLQIRLEWDGSADLDLSVTEPTGTLCSFSNPETQNGGLHTHDGYGPGKTNCFEEYVCPRGFPGEYRLHIKQMGGVLVGQRAELTIRFGVGTAAERVQREVVNLENGEAVRRIDLPQGRRQQPRTVLGTAMTEPEPQAVRRMGQRRDQQAIRQALAELQQDRFREGSAGRPVAAGVVAPVVQVIPDGRQVTAGVTVSADRRYVRLAISPQFTTITDVFTFSP